jgi:hypothetical protein
VLGVSPVTCYGIGRSVVVVVVLDTMRSLTGAKGLSWRVSQVREDAVALRVLMSNRPRYGGHQLPNCFDSSEVCNRVFTIIIFLYSV